MPSKNLLTLNNGWPFGDGPMTRGLQFESRGGRIFAVCASCPQGITALTDTDPDPIRPAYVVTLELLKSRIADHWLKCHAEEIAAETYC